MMAIPAAVSAISAAASAAAPAMAVMGAAGSVMQYQSSKAQAKATAQQNTEARKAAAQEYNDLTKTEAQVYESERMSGMKQQIAAFEQAGRVNVMAGASGTYGGSVDNMLSDIRTSKGRNLSSIISNSETRIDQVRMKAEGIKWSAQRSQRVVQKPSAVGAAFNAVSSAASGYSAGRSFSTKTSGAVPAISGG